MSQPTGTDRGRLEDLWRYGQGSGPAGTQPIPVVTEGAGPASGRPLGTPPGGMSRLRGRPARRSFRSFLLEIVLAVLVCTGVAAAMGWTVLRDLNRVIPGNGVDPYIELWSLGWS